ncbi:SHSP domain-containing protein [Mycena indigotica]|uniref:SHSP domain-containing protein n=1 Tax=Mycena indigotica TaxID=2126181 RepID=A0A8H6TG72_9AGAR|nr:SHSP domain-containing protein [Mycena indigotica]KAF7316162.1 SHSP domain-containing protein [Mycena indigotica]
MAAECSRKPPAQYKSPRRRCPPPAQTQAHAKAMSVFYYDPFTDFERLFDDAFRARTNNTHNQLVRPTSENSAVQAFRPKMDLHENAASNTVTATFELPGIKKEEVHIETAPGRLRISAESRISEEHEKDGYAIRERRFGKFSRTLQLPHGVKEEEIKASMENGVLTVTFPKTAAEQTPKKITIA